MIDECVVRIAEQAHCREGFRSFDRRHANGHRNVQQEGDGQLQSIPEVPDPSTGCNDPLPDGYEYEQGSKRTQLVRWLSPVPGSL